jgi:hypothetical protein
MVEQANSTLRQIRDKVRRLVFAGDPSVLPDSEIERQINTFGTQSMPFRVRINDLIKVHQFFTERGVDQYPIDRNLIRELTTPLTIQGFTAGLSQDPVSFFQIYPKIYETKQLAGDGSSGPYDLTLSSLPLMPRTVSVAATLVDGTQAVLLDDGEGNLGPAALGSGTVDYQSAEVSATFANIVDTDQNVTFRYVAQEWTRPRDALFVNNIMTLRPVPDDNYRVEFYVYQTPVAFISDNQNPEVDFWWEYLAFGAAKKILQDRNDYETLQGVEASLRELESEIVNQTAAELNQSRTATIYNNPVTRPGRIYGL